MRRQAGQIRVMHVGLGAVGSAIARQIAGRRGFRSVGAADIDPSCVGRDLGDVAGLGRAVKIKVAAEARKAIKASKPDVAVVCTGATLKEVTPLILDILQTKTPIVCASKELVYPTKPGMRYARAIHEAAKRAKVAVLGVGANPGLAMDALPIALTAVCESVQAVRVERVQDARHRRVGFQHRIGAGLTPEQFQKEVDHGRVRHVGLTASLAMIADALGWKLDRTTDEVRPKVAADTVVSEFVAVDPGFVCGIVQEAVGYRNGTPLVTLRVESYLGAAESYDAVTIEGSPSIRMRIDGGIHGDSATASLAVNSLARVLDAAPGLHTMRDMPLPSFNNG